MGGNDMLLEFHREQKKYKEKLPVVKKKESREEETLKMLAKFKQKLSGLKVDEEKEKDDYEGEYECPLKKERNKKKEEIQKELKALTKELKPKKKKEHETGSVVEEKVTEKERGNDMLLEFHREQKKYKEKLPVVKKKESREEETLKMLAKFKQKLSGLKVDDEKEKVEDEDDEELVGDDWMKNTLRFESNDPVLAKDASTKDDDWFDIYDPRNPLNKRRR